MSGTVALWGIGGTKESGSTSFTVGSTWTQVSVPLDVTQAGHTKMRAQVYESTTGTTYHFDGAAIDSGDSGGGSVTVTASTFTATPPAAAMAGRSTAATTAAAGR